VLRLGGKERTLDITVKLLTNLIVQSQIAMQQLTQVSRLLQQQQPSTAKDRRQSPLCKRNGDLDTSMIYNTLKSANSSQDPWANFVWKNKAPPRVRFFTWLLSQGRIQCKTNLIKKRTRYVKFVMRRRRHLNISFLDAPLPSILGASADTYAG
jgi:hypothetical protein